MYWDERTSQLVWLYALPLGQIASCPYQTVDFEGGLYAVAVCVDQDDADGERVYQAIKDWVAVTGVFAPDESSARPTLFHVVTSDAAFEKLKQRQLDIYVPIR
jgi:DNA gyrase inhibitor GyrI